MISSLRFGRNSRNYRTSTQYETVIIITKSGICSHYDLIWVTHSGHFCTPDNSSGKIDNRPFGKSSDLCIS